MDRLWWALLALCACGDGSSGGLGSGGGDGGGEPRGNGHTGAFLDGSLPTLGDAGGSDGPAQHVDGGRADASIDAGAVDAGIVRDGSVRDADTPSDAAAATCSHNSPCLLDAIEIPMRVVELEEPISNLRGARAVLGESGGPVYLDTIVYTLEPKTVEFHVGNSDPWVDDSARQLAYDGSWSGRADICVRFTDPTSEHCWEAGNATLEGFSSTTIVRFDAVLDPLEFMPSTTDPGDTWARVGGRWEVWGY